MNKTSKDTVDISGAILTIDGKQTLVEDGELVVHTDYLYSADDEDDPTMTAKSIEIDVELATPDDFGYTRNDDLRELADQMDKYGNADVDRFAAELREIINE